MIASSTKRSGPTISAIIHFLNSAKYLSQAVQSVFRQTLTDWELILVDGGSTDGSTEIARECEKQFPNKIRAFIHQGSEPLGIFSSRIWGAQRARASVLALLDSDDEWHPQFLERHYAIYQMVFNDGQGMVYCPSVYWWEDTALAHRSFVQPVPTPGLHMPPKLVWDFIEPGYAKTPCNTSVMVAREIIQEARFLIGIAVEKMGDDQFLWSHIALKYPIYVSPEPLTRYRQWANSTCAEGSAVGEYEKLRRLHLTWLLDHLLAASDGPDKHAMVEVVRAYLNGKKPRFWLGKGSLFERLVSKIGKKT